MAVFALLAACGSLPLWPLPSKVIEPVPGSSLLVKHWNWNVSIPGGSSLLDRACERYTALINDTVSWNPTLKRAQHIDGKSLTGIYVNVEKAEMSTVLTLNSDESYKLHVNSSSTSVQISAVTVWGAIRALETLSQLVTPPLIIAHATIYDSPRFTHREFLLDTARYFLDVAYLKHTLDAMSYSKLNVLHCEFASLVSLTHIFNSSFCFFSQGMWLIHNRSLSKQLLIRCFLKKDRLRHTLTYALMLSVSTAAMT
jgi:hypothetical protein